MTQTTSRLSIQSNVSPEWAKKITSLLTTEQGVPRPTQNSICWVLNQLVTIHLVRSGDHYIFLVELGMNNFQEAMEEVDRIQRYLPASLFSKKKVVKKEKPVEFTKQIVNITEHPDFKKDDSQ